MRVVSGSVSRAEHPVGPLTGTLVLDFGQTAVGPVSAMFLGYLGATVIKVEHPRGELGRFDVSRKHGAGMTFLSTNLGKFGVVFDLKDPLDRAYTLDLLARADVVVDNFRSPEVMQRLGLDFFDVMRPINPGLVYVQSSSFQGLGPLKDFPSFEWAAQALSGFAGATGRMGEKPEFSRGTAYLDWSGAMMNVVAALAGLHRRRATGEGAMLSTSQFGTSVFVGASTLVTHSRDPVRLGHDFGGCLLDRAFATSDGFISICVPTEAVWRRLMTAVALPTDSPVDPTGSELEPVLKSDMTEAWVARLHHGRVPCGAVTPAPTLVEALRAVPQVMQEGLIREYDANRGGILYAAPPWSIVDVKEESPRPAPELGEHDLLIKSILKPLPPRERAGNAGVATEWRMGPLSEATPLRGERILEIGTGLAVGTAGMILAELGADVTKVLPPWGDIATDKPSEQSDWLHGDKAMERLDLRTEPARERLKDLVLRSSVVIVSGPMRFRRNFALEEADVRAMRSDIVYCGLTGHGRTGPLADIPATEFDIQLISGMTRQVGTRGEMPVRQGFHLASVNTGLAAVQAVLAGLLVRDGGRGVGRHYEVSLLRSAVALNGWNITAESGNDGVEGKQVQAAGWPPDHGYTCRDRQVLVSIKNNDEGWVSFLAALGRVDLLADSRFSTLPALRINEWRLPVLLEPDTRSLTSTELARIVGRCGGEVIPVLDPDEVLDHAQTRAQGLVRQDIRALRLPIDVVSR